MFRLECKLKFISTAIGLAGYLLASLAALSRMTPSGVVNELQAVFSV